MWQSSAILGLYLRKKLSGKSRDYRDVIVFSKRFTFTSKRKAGVSKLLQFEERLGKAPFSWRISVDDGPNRRKKAAFSNFSDLV